MQLSSIKQFLEVYRKSLDTEDSKKERIQQIFKEELGITIDKKAFVVKKGVLHITANTIIKNEIFLRKGKIVSLLAVDKQLAIYDIA